MGWRCWPAYSKHASSCTFHPPPYLADPKVAQHDNAAAVQENVLRLEVAVQHPVAMDVQQRRRHLEEHPSRAMWVGDPLQDDHTLQTNQSGSH
jgi:hypothetical protein